MKKSEKDKQFKKVNDLYNSMCCLLVYREKDLLNYTIERLQKSLEKLKI